jgi:hypothetical protein
MVSAVRESIEGMSAAIAKRGGARLADRPPAGPLSQLVDRALIRGERFGQLSGHAKKSDRPCPEQNSLSVREAFAAEAHLLMKLPDNNYPLLERVPVTAGKTPSMSAAGRFRD